MRRIIVTICFVFAISCGFGSNKLVVEPPPKASTKIPCSGDSQDDVRESLFKHMIVRAGDLTSCLAIDEKDASGEFMKRFGNPSVRKYSECNWKEGLVIDKNGKDAIILGLTKTVEITPDLVIVQAYYSRGGLSAAGYEYVLKRDCTWRIIGEQMQWIA